MCYENGIFSNREFPSRPRGYPRPVSIIDEYQDKFTPISYDPKKGTSFKLTEQTTIYNNQTKTTEVKQNWWQKLWYDTK